MINYIRADLKRIILRIPRIIATLCIYAIFAIVLWFSKETGLTSITFLSNTVAYIGYLPILLGLVELLAVFSDDFHAKTMQVAIGLGISRLKVVVCKLIEMILLVIFDFSILFAMIMTSSFIVKVNLTPVQVGEIWATLFMCGLAIVSYTSITMILMFHSQSTGAARILYLGLVTHMVEMVLEILFSLKYIEVLRLNNFTLKHFLSVAQARWVIGIFDFKSMIAIVLYIVAAVAITSTLFKKRELEF